MLPDDVTDAGLLGVSFFGGRGLSMPFSGGEWAGLARGVAGSLRSAAKHRHLCNSFISVHVNMPFTITSCTAHLIGHIYNQVIAFLSITVL